MPPLFPVRLRWPSAPGAIRYRVVAHHIIAGELLKLEADEPELQVDLLPELGGEWPQWRVQVSTVDGSWVDYLPYMDWPAAEDDSAAILRWPEDGALLHRVVVHDDSTGEHVIKAATLEPAYALDCARIDRSHSFRWRAQRWEDGAWLDGAPYLPLVLNGQAAVVSEPEPAAAEPAQARDDGPVLFLFTSDTEVHLRWMAEPDGGRGIEQQIFGRFAGEEVGVGLQMSMLEEHGYKGTFFVDILAEYQFGEGSLQPVFDEILGRGHDVQLHLHSSPHLRFAKDERIRALSMATYRDDPAMFRGALELAIALYERRAGRSPVAYRAGAYRIFQSHFPILCEFGIVIDSSVNPFKNCNVVPWLAAATQPVWVDGVLEVPVTWHLRNDAKGRRAQQLAPVASPTVQRAAVAAVTGTGDGPPRTVCYIAHSYSFLGRTKIDDRARWAAWNERWEQLVGTEERLISGYNVGAPLIELSHVDQRRIDAFRQVLADLGRRTLVAGISLAELAERAEPWQAPAVPFDPVASYDRHGSRCGATGTRRYSGSYLGQLEGAGAS